MNCDSVLQAATQLRQWRRGSERAPHKPLLLLLALGRVYRSEPRLVTLGDIEDGLRGLLENFGPPRQRQQPQLPFWHLQNDGLWDVPDRHQVPAAKGKGSPLLTDLRPLPGGLPVWVHECLRANPKLVGSLAGLLLRDHFQPSLHADILDQVGLPPDVGSAIPARQVRDPTFRLRILRAYEFACAVCSYDGRLDTVSVGLEAAHIQWWSHNGPDVVGNGVAMCTLHHKALDLGVIGLDEQLRVQVSQAFHGGARTHELVVAYSGAPLRSPQGGQPQVVDRHRMWHATQVFRGPPRVPLNAA